MHLFLLKFEFTFPMNHVIFLGIFMPPSRDRVLSTMKFNYI